jgi:hypothetical protein
VDHLTRVEKEAPAKVVDRGFRTKGVIAGNDHQDRNSTTQAGNRHQGCLIARPIGAPI